MAVNSHLIYECLNSYNKLKVVDSTECFIEYVTIYNPQLDVRNDTVYIIVDCDQFPMDISEQPSLMIVIGDIQACTIHQTQHQVICVDKDYSLKEIYAQIQDVIKKYSDWEKSLADMLFFNVALSEICRASVEIFENPFTIQTGNFELIGIGENQFIKYPYKFREGDSDFLSDEWIKSAFERSDKCFKTRGPFEFNYIKEHISLLYNIYDGKKYKAQICVDANHRDIVRGDYTRIEILSRYILRYITKADNGKIVTHNKFRSLLKNYVLKEMDNREALVVALKTITWSENSNYFCVAIKIEVDIAQVNPEYLCRCVENTMNKSVVFYYNDVVYAICNNNLNSMLSSATYKKLESISQRFFVKIGISTCFDNFYDCRDYFKQARATLKILVAKNISTNISYFKDVALKYLVKYGSDSLPIKVLLPTNLKTIIEHDQNHATEYYKTLRAYLQNNLNVTNTTNSLFLHRSTFKYRMQKIDEIMNIDYNNLDEVMYLQMILYLIDINDAL